MEEIQYADFCRRSIVGATQNECVVLRLPGILEIVGAIWHNRVTTNIAMHEQLTLINIITGYCFCRTFYFNYLKKVTSSQCSVTPTWLVKNCSYQSKTRLFKRKWFQGHYFISRYIYLIYLVFTNTVKTENMACGHAFRFTFYICPNELFNDFMI